MSNIAMNNKPHHGKNLKRFREILGVKQETIAFELGEDWDQKKVSRLEEKEVIEDELMEQIAAILKVPSEAIKNFDDEKTVQIITNTFNDSSINHGAGGAINYYHTINPVEKWVDALEENKRLYTALLKEKDERNALLEKLLMDKQ